MNPHRPNAALPALPAFLTGRLVCSPQMFWRLQTGSWLIFILFTLPLKTALFSSLPYAIVLSVYREPLGFVLTSLFRLLYRRMRIHSNQFGRLLLCVVPLSFAAALLDAALGLEVDRLAGHATVVRLTAAILLFRWFLYVSWSFLYFWIKDMAAARERELALSRAETAAREAELLMLRAQVSPHFLFNAFNTILAGLDRRPAELTPVVQGLADYFRYSLAHRHAALVHLGDEFAAAMNYLTVEKARFRDSLIIDSMIDPSVRPLPVPGIFLQPLIENALKYGHRTSPTPLRVRLRVGRSAGGGAMVEVANSGEWIEPPPVRPQGDAGGCGLANLRRRLEILYPEFHSLEISKSAPHGEVVVRVHFPASA